ncbi:MAG TPA: hypothetical protein VIK77_05565 [Tissierellaceae bacterium]
MTIIPEKNKLKLNGEQQRRSLSKMDIYKQLSEKGNQIFLFPDEEYPAWNIIQGVKIKGFQKTQFAFNTNTVRKLERINKAKLVPGPKKLAQEFFCLNMEQILQKLKGIKEGDKQAFDKLSEEVSIQLRESLSKNVIPERLEVYNLVRKIVDLTFEHITAMAEELKGYRHILVPLLNVPLDGWILNSNIIFNKEEKKKLGISKGNGNARPGMGCIKNLEKYQEIQAFIYEKAKNISKNGGYTFYPIYFDLLWNNRYERNGGNLFKTNPK